MLEQYAIYQGTLMIKRLFFATPVGACFIMVTLWYCWILTSHGTIKAFHLDNHPYAALLICLFFAVFFLGIIWAVSEVSKQLESDSGNCDDDE